MASISISEEDFMVLAAAAMDAKARGDMASAQRLDRLARKANASLSNAKAVGVQVPGLLRPPPIKWTDVPSTLSAM